MIFTRRAVDEDVEMYAIRTARGCPPGLAALRAMLEGGRDAQCVPKLAIVGSDHEALLCHRQRAEGFAVYNLGASHRCSTRAVKGSARQTFKVQTSSLPHSINVDARVEGKHVQSLSVLR